MLLNFKFRCFAIRLFIEFVEGGTAFGTCFIDFIGFFYVILLRKFRLSMFSP